MGAADWEAWAKERLAGLEAAGLLRSLPEPVVRGRALFSSNDYLGLAARAELARAAAEAAGGGFGAAASRLVTGNHPEHVRLEDETAGLMGREAACLFGAGYLANLGVMRAVGGADAVILSDERNHASIIDGCRLSGAEIRVYAHADPDDLRRKAAGTRLRRVVVTEGIFSMDGDAAPLAEISAVAREFEALLVVDEAHAFGLLGGDGRGLADACGAGADLIVGTYSKAAGSMGGWAAGSRTLVELVRNLGRTFIYSTALPPPVCAASRAALGIFRGEPGLRRTCLENARAIADAARGAGFDAVEPAAGIVPIVTGSVESARALAGAIAGHGWHVPAIRPPTVPAGTARIRLTGSALQTPADIERLSRALAEGRRALS